VPKSDLVAQKISEIRPRFLAALSQRLDRLEEIRDQLETVDDVWPLMVEIRSEAHTTVGLAATLGFHDLGLLAQEVEIFIHRAEKAGETSHFPEDGLYKFDSMIGEMALLIP
jgi:HPt (histidine-containing phosphotransfer) domain-containing protein